MKLFLLVYDRRKGVLLEKREFRAEQRSEALRKRFERERACGESEDLEIVLLGAASWEDLEKTHSRYFKRVEDLSNLAAR